MLAKFGRAAFDLAVASAILPRAKARMVRTAICAALMLLFLWPAIYNGQPLFCVDTTAYIRGFDAGVVWLSERTTVWTTWARPATRQGGPDDSTVGVARSFQSPTFIIAGRSVAYGALLYLGELLGGLWASVVIQAAAALAAISLTLRHLKLFSWPKLMVTAITLGLVSSLPFFASFLLPDVFAGLSLLAAANLLALGDRLRPWERVFWVSILAAAVVFHPSHLAIVVVLLAAAVMAWLFSAKISQVGIVALAFATGIGVASEFGFALVIEKLQGVQVSRPPVIMARIVADGPGAAYLREKCPQAGFVACEFVDRLGSNSDAFLWDTSPATGIYAPASIDKRRQLANEQYRFAAAVFAYDPVGQIVAWLNDALQQLKMAGLSDFLSTAEEAYPKLPRTYAERMAKSPVWRKDFPIAFFSALTIFTAIFSLIFVAVTLMRYWKIVSIEQKLFCFVILLGQVSNALICGALSGPHDRYQARLTWLIPLVALLVYYERCAKGASLATMKKLAVTRSSDGR
jgi:hypothetical protein